MGVVEDAFVNTLAMRSRMTAKVESRWERIKEVQLLSAIFDDVLEGDTNLASVFLVMMSLNKWLRTPVTVTCSHTLQALLAATPSGEVSDEDWTSPYVSHAVLLPEPIQCGDGITIDVVILCSLGPGDPFGVMLSREGRDLPFTFTGGFDLDDPSPTHVELDYTDGDEHVEILAPTSEKSRLEGITKAMRVAIGLQRLIISAPPSDRDGTVSSEHVEIKTRNSKKAKKKSVYVRNVFAVEPKLVEACKAYMRGDRNAPSVRWITRGHWRNQAVGKMWSRREPRWIRPHWKGPVKGLVKPVEVRVK